MVRSTCIRMDCGESSKDVFALPKPAAEVFKKCVRGKKAQLNLSMFELAGLPELTPRRVKKMSKHVKKMWLCRNKMAHIPQWVYKLRLTKLYLTANVLTELEPITWRELRELHANSNQLRELDITTAPTQLTVVEVCHNQLEHVSAGVVQSETMVLLRLAGNRLRTLPSIHLPCAQQVSLRENRLTHVPASIVLPRCEELDLGDNPLEYLPLGLLAWRASLRINLDGAVDTLRSPPAALLQPATYHPLVPVPPPPPGEEEEEAGGGNGPRMHTVNVRDVPDADEKRKRVWEYMEALVAAPTRRQLPYHLITRTLDRSYRVWTGHWGHLAPVPPTPPPLPDFLTQPTPDQREEARQREQQAREREALFEELQERQHQPPDATLFEGLEEQQRGGHQLRTARDRVLADIVRNRPYLRAAAARGVGVASDSDESDDEWAMSDDEAHAVDGAAALLAEIRNL